MIEKFNGEIIDIFSASLIINKLKFYIENEEVIIDKIKNSFSILDTYYLNENNKIIKNKKMSYTKI